MQNFTFETISKVTQMSFTCIFARVKHQPTAEVQVISLIYACQIPLKILGPTEKNEKLLYNNCIIIW